MNIKRCIIESTLYCLSKTLRAPKRRPDHPRSIFVLRNNDLGDLIVITPLFEALKRTFPKTKIFAGIGDWSRPILENNPWVDEIVPINAPWHNKFCTKHGHNTLQGWVDALRYIYGSNEVKQLKNRHCDIGIDVLGSPQGSLLMMHAKIPWRIGVRGYAGGYAACQAYVQYDAGQAVGEQALEYVKLLGADNLPSSKPQLYLTQEEIDWAQHTWASYTAGKSCLKIIAAPGAGFEEKCWPADYFAQLIQMISHQTSAYTLVVGGKSDEAKGKIVCSLSTDSCTGRCGTLSLRQTFALVAQADLVITNSSMLMHVGPAFSKNTLVVLGPLFEDTKGHDHQWGHPPYTYMVGKELNRPVMPSAQLTFEELKKLRWI